jgi:glycosyltransferase involved in cell wall biosynthesis
MDAETWLERIGFITGVFEAETTYADVHAFYHLPFRQNVVRNNVTYHFTGLARRRLIIPIGFNNDIAKLKPDVIVVHGLVFPFQVILLARKLPRVRIFCQHHAELPFRDLRRSLQRVADRYVSGYFFTSAAQARPWHKAGVIRDLNKVWEIMGTSSVFRPTRDRTVSDLKRRTFLWVGHLDNNKDPLTLLQAFAVYSREYPDAVLSMVYQTRILEQDVRKLIDSLQLSTVAHMIGKCTKKELERWYNESDYIISTSHYEGSGIAVCEALSCGCIPIVTDIPSLRKMTDNGRIGFLFPPGDADALAQVLQRASQINIAAASESVLAWFEKELSFHGNAAKIKAALSDHS